MTFEALSPLPPESTLSRTRLARQGSKHIVLRTLELGAATFVGPRHPSVLPLIELEAFDGGQVALYDFVAGVTLRELLLAYRAQSRPAPLDVLGRVIIDAATALGAVTATHWHNGISDAAILIGFDGITRVLDYGAPRVSGRYGSRSALPGAQRDVFTLGAVVHSALTGFGGHYATTARLDPPSKAHAEVGPALDDVVMTAMSPALDQRQASVTQLANELDGALGGGALDALGVAAVLKRMFRERVASLIKATSVLNAAAKPGKAPEKPTFSIADEEEPATEISPPFKSMMTGTLAKELAPPAIAPNVAVAPESTSPSAPPKPVKPASAISATPLPVSPKPGLPAVVPSIAPLKPPPPLEITAIATSPQGASIPMRTVIISPNAAGYSEDEEKTNIGTLPDNRTIEEFNTEENTIVAALETVLPKIEAQKPAAAMHQRISESTNAGVVPVSLGSPVIDAHPATTYQQRPEETRSDRLGGVGPTLPTPSPPSPPFDLFAAPPPVRAPRALGEETGEGLISGSVLSGESLLVRESEEVEQTESPDPMTGEDEVSASPRSSTLVPQALFIVVALMAALGLSVLIFIRTRSQIVRVPMTPATLIADAGDHVDSAPPSMVELLTAPVDAGADDENNDEDEDDDAGPGTFERTRADGGSRALPHAPGAPKHMKKRPGR